MSFTFKIKAVVFSFIFLCSTYPNEKLVSQNQTIDKVAALQVADSVTILKKEYKVVKNEKNENIDKLIAAKKKADSDVLKLKKEKKVLTTAWIESQREIINLKMELAAKSDKPEIEFAIPDTIENKIDTLITHEIKKEHKIKKKHLFGLKW